MTESDRVGFGVAISTIGRWDDLDRLLGDLAAQTLPPRAVAIAYEQSEDADAAFHRLTETYGHRFAVRGVVKTGGCTVGMNAAADLIGDDADWLLFPNDTYRFSVDVLERMAAHCVAPTTACVVPLVDPAGNMRALPARGSAMTRLNVWRATGIVVRRKDFERVGGFDPTLGTGAATPWQSGDETDLLLRLSLLDDFSVEWIDDVTIRTQTDFAHLPPSERRRKLRTYGRGTGYVYRRWEYPAWAKLRVLAGAATLPLRRPSEYGFGDGMVLLIGRTEGLLGRNFTRDEDHRAVLR